MPADHAASPADGSTRLLAGYALATDFAALPAEVVDRAMRVIADEIGCMVLGSTLPAGRRLATFAAGIGGAAEATVIGAGLRAPAGYAALANGTSSHADELDGVHVSQGHPAGASVAAGLALCEANGLGGQDLITAVVVSFDVGCRIMLAMGGNHAIRREHHVIGTPLYAVGIAAAAGRLLGLGRLAIQHAMALALMHTAAPAAIYAERNHLSKALNQGQAAYAGVMGAALASYGMEAHDQVIEARDGLIDGWRTPRADLSLLTAGLGTDYSVLDAGFKYYSAGYPIHSPLAGLLALMDSRGITAGQLARVRVGMPPSSADVVDDRAMPSICLQDMLSVGAVRGGLTFEDAHDEALLARPDVQRLRTAIEIVRDTSLPADAAHRRVSWVEIETRDGRRFTGPRRIAPGHWELGGMPWDDLRQKFESLAGPRLGAAACDTAFRFLRELPDRDDLTVLGRLLAGPCVQ